MRTMYSLLSVAMVAMSIYSVSLDWVTTDRSLLWMTCALGFNILATLEEKKK